MFPRRLPIPTLLARCLPTVSSSLDFPPVGPSDTALRLLRMAVLLPRSAVLWRIVAVGVSCLMATPFPLAAFFRFLPAMACLRVYVVGARVSSEAQYR